MQLTGGKMAVKCIPLVEGMDEDMLLGEVKVQPPPHLLLFSNSKDIF